MSDPLLTADELEAITKISEAYNAIAKTMASGNGNDQREVVDKIHQLQAMVMANAAARAYPGKFRLLGGALDRGDANVCGHRWDGFVCYVELDEEGNHGGDHLSAPGVRVGSQRVREGDMPRPDPWLRVPRSVAISSQ
jgi:hypothetical protein